MIKISLISIFGLLFAIVFALPVDRNTENTQIEDVGEYGDHFEGDMILTDEQINDVTSKLTTRNGMIKLKYRWPKRIVPYKLSSEHTQAQQGYIELALKTLESVSCLKFVPRTDETDYVELRGQSGGCYSEVGHQGGKQVLNLQPYTIEVGCFRLATIMHEFLHALGFYHMQSAYDRDDYVTIQYDNIKDGTKHNFNKYGSSEVTHFNTTYDYESVMHYGAYGFSKNGKPTIVPIDESYLTVIGQRTKLSDTDIKKLNQMYECNEDLEEQDDA